MSRLIIHGSGLLVALAMGGINDSHVVFDIDLDLDGQPDKVVSSAPNMGDELIFFLREGDGYRKVLRSTITNFFPKGEDVAVHYVSYRDEGWVLSRTVYRISDWRQRGNHGHRCEVMQGVPMQELALEGGSEKVQGLPEAAGRDEACEIE